MQVCKMWLMALLMIVAIGQAGEQVLVIEQDYNIVEQGKEGINAKDIRQKLYISKDMITIDDLGGSDAKATESIIIDLKNRKIINLNHIDKKKVTEDFDARRKRLDTKKKNIQQDYDNQPAGPQKDKLEKLYRALLDDKRRFALAKDAGAKKTLMGIECIPVKVIAEEQPDYIPFEAQVNPDLELPYDNAEVLYLLQIIGEKMSEFMKKHKEIFKHVPMEIHLDLAAGGRLDTKVVSIQKMDKERLTADLRGPLGNPFVVPENYDEQQRRVPPKVQKGDRPD
jgi:hypothetical protein